MVDAQTPERSTGVRFTNFTDFFGARAREHPDRIALLHPGGALSYRELDARIWRSAADLHAQGVEPGSVLAPACEDELSILLVSLGALRLGATVFALPRGLAGPALAAELGRAGVNVVAGLRCDAMPPAARRIAFDAARPGTFGEPVDPSIRCAQPGVPAVLVSTSGSTGRSRLFPIGHRSYLHRLEHTFVRDPVQADDRVFSQVHLDFETGRRIVVTALYRCGTAVLVDRRAASSLVEICARHAITVVWTTASDLEWELDRLPADVRIPALPTVRELYVGTATVGESLRERAMARLSPQLHIRYGTNECGLVSIATPEQIRRQPGTVGRPEPGVQVQIFDAQARLVGPGEVGEVRIRTPGMFDGYLDDAQANARALRDGWFHPGDLARWAPDGQLIHCGRADDLMIVRGINVYPAEIERVLGEHPAVREAVAFPVRSRNAQEIPVCAVVAHVGQRSSDDELLAYARERLGSRAPHFIVVLDRLPRTAQGKVDRPTLREAVMQWLARRAGPTADSPAGPALHRSPAPASDTTIGQPPVNRLQIGFRSPAPDRIDSLVPWFAEWLRIDAPGCAPVAAGSDDAAAAPARRFLSHALALTMRLLQAGGVPAFGNAWIEDCATQPDEAGRWRAAVALPTVELIEPRVCELALRAALDACSAMSALPLTDDSRATSSAGLEQAIRRIAALVPQGKSTIPLLREAHARAIPFVHLGQGVYQLGWGSKGVRTNRSMTARDSAIGARRAQSKTNAAALLRVAGLPAPTHGLADTAQQAAQLARRLGWPVVVKPDDADRGEGVSVDVHSDERLLAAFGIARAGRPNKPVIVERQVPGVCYRLFVARGRLLYAVRRLPKSVIGDGRSTVAMLIAQANRVERALPPWSRTEPYPDDDEARAAIVQAGFTIDRVPAAGVPVPLRRIESTAAGGFDQEVTGEVHPVNVDAALRAASLFDLDVAGIDIISPDIAEPWYRNGAVINEVNFAPLLGGGEISRSHIAGYLARIVDGDGTIPIEAIVDRSPDLVEARRRQQAWTQRGARCWLTSARRTSGPDGRERPMPFTTLGERFRALILDCDVDALILVAEAPAQLESLPVRTDPQAVTTAA